MKPGSLLAALVAALALAMPAQGRMLRQVGAVPGVDRGSGFGAGTGVAGLQGYGGDRGDFGYDNPLTYGVGQTRQAIVTSDVAGTTSVGAIEGDNTRGSQAAAYARGASKATGLTALGLAVSYEKDGGGAATSAAGDAIRRQAGYQGSSSAGDIFSGASFDDSAAGRAIRRTQADNAALQARIGQSAQRYGSTSPFDI